MTTQLLPENRLVDELVGLWLTVCHGFSNEYFSISPAVNVDGVDWLIFSYDYTDEVGPSTYPSLAVPVAKLQREAIDALHSQTENEIMLHITAVPVQTQRPGCVYDPRIPCCQRQWNLTIILNQSSHVVACIATETRFDKGQPSYPLPLKPEFRRGLNKKETLKLVVNQHNLTAAHIAIDPWREYVPNVPNQGN